MIGPNLVLYTKVLDLDRKEINSLKQVRIKPSYHCKMVLVMMCGNFHLGNLIHDFQCDFCICALYAVSFIPWGKLCRIDIIS